MSAWSSIRIAALSGLFACTHGLAGDVAAHKTGDLSNPRAARGRFDEALVEACGSGDATEEGLAQLSRHPYLQQVTAHSAKVLFTSSSGGAPELVLTLPDGTEVTRVRTVEDPKAASAGKAQWVGTLEGLEANTIYCYEIEDLTARTGFKTAPETGSDQTVRFAVIGDSGSGSSDQRDVRNQMMSVPLDFMLHTGDIAYEDGKMSQLEARFFDVYRELLSKVPAFVTLGNHDYRTSEGGPYLRAFSLRENGAPTGTERWYSFDWGSVHFVALDTERVGEEQAAWLDRDLSENEQPWSVVFLHKPPFSNGEHGDNESVQRTFVPIFEAHRVQLVLAGHDHDYERFNPKNGVRYVVTGGGGNRTRKVGSDSATAFSEAVLHFVFIEANRQELLLHAIDATGFEFDSALIKNAGDNRNPSSTETQSTGREGFGPT